MNIKKPYFLRNAFTRFEVMGDKAAFNRIVADMMENGGDLAPSDHWNWKLGNQNSATSYTDELYEAKYSNLQLMLDPWIGVTGMRPIDATIVARYQSYLKAIDHLSILSDDILLQGQSNDWKETDLGSIMDINLITAALDFPRNERIFACEVGGGYGRLAEVFLGDLFDSVHYVLIDAVPGSLMYAYLYLKSQFPERKIGSYYHGDVYNENFDCYIMPAWYSHLLPNQAFNISINIESMQEMEQHHVDYYLALFDRATKQDGLIYLSNARDYVFRGNWNFPKHWDTIALHNTPRSWSPDHPTHIVRKRNGDFALKRQILEDAYKQQVLAWNQHQQTLALNNAIFAEYQKTIANQENLCREFQQTIADLKSGAIDIDLTLLQIFFSRMKKLIKR